MDPFPQPQTAGAWSEQALRVLQERYLIRDPDGRVLETPDQMCWRVARTIAQAEEAFATIPERIYNIASQFYQMMIDHLFLPNSPTLMNAGAGDGRLQYSACYVLPVEDSIEGIFDAVKNAAIIHQSGGGTGFSFSRLRPKGSQVRTSGGVASGPVSFMQVFDAATEQIKQGGRRRGANMGILRVDHPDILEFINCKLTGGITNFNISVAITDEFMQALQNEKEYHLVTPHAGQIVGRLKAQEVFDQIVQAAWQTGDPGLFFIDRCNASSANPTPNLSRIEATNPCGEQPLFPYESCNLGSIDLSRFVQKTDATWPIPHPSQAIDWNKLEEVVRLAVRFLDNVIEVNPYPLPEITQMVKSNRRIGLGVMGWADLLFYLGIPYNSKEALELADQIMSFINRIGHAESQNLAQRRKTFPNWNESIYARDLPLRNATVTTIAPTGSISIINNGCSSGVEPVFALAYEHRVEKGKVDERRLLFINPAFEKIAKKQGFYNADWMAEVTLHGTLKGLTSVPAEIARIFVSAHEIAPEWHVRMQAAFQKHTDNGVSKTINLPNSATRKDVYEAYRLAYELGCLGITVFRDGCKNEQVLYRGTSQITTSDDRTVKPRPHSLHGVTYRQRTPLGTAFITVNENGLGDPFETFVSIGKAGSDIAAVAEALGRLISLCLRMPSALNPRGKVIEIIGQLSGIGGQRTLGFGEDRIRSLPDGIAKVLTEHIGFKNSQTNDEQSISTSGDFCPECGQATLVFEEGCRKCHSCGFTEC